MNDNPEILKAKNMTGNNPASRTTNNYSVDPTDPHAQNTQSVVTRDGEMVIVPKNPPQTLDEYHAFMDGSLERDCYYDPRNE